MYDFRPTPEDRAEAQRRLNTPAAARPAHQPAMSPDLQRFHVESVKQQGRYVRREITHEQLHENLRALADRLQVTDQVDWSEFTFGPGIPVCREGEPC